MKRFNRIAVGMADSRGRSHVWRALVPVIALFFAQLAFSADAPARGDEIPPLRPPVGEVKPGTWERYGTHIILGAGIALMLAAGAATRLLRPKPASPIAPEVLVRTRLMPLTGRPQDAAGLSLVSRALRGYLAAVFKLPPGELTTTEFAQSLNTCAAAGRELAGAASEFLQRCDREKFAPQQAAPSWDAAAEALRLVDMAEAKRKAEAPPPQT